MTTRPLEGEVPPLLSFAFSVVQKFVLAASAKPSTIDQLPRLTAFGKTEITSDFGCTADIAELAAGSTMARMNPGSDMPGWRER